jgi:hypothetical protein
MNLNLDARLHDQFKAATAAQGQNMTDVITQFIESYVRKHLPGGLKTKKQRRP